MPCEEIFRMSREEVLSAVRRLFGGDPVILREAQKNPEVMKMSLDDFAGKIAEEFLSEAMRSIADSMLASGYSRVEVVDFLSLIRGWAIYIARDEACRYVAGLATRDEAVARAVEGIRNKAFDVLRNSFMDGTVIFIPWGEEGFMLSGAEHRGLGFELIFEKKVTIDYISLEWESDVYIDLDRLCYVGDTLCVLSSLTRVIPTRAKSVNELNDALSRIKSLSSIIGNAMRQKLIRDPKEAVEDDEIRGYAVQLLDEILSLVELPGIEGLDLDDRKRYIEEVMEILSVDADPDVYAVAVLAGRREGRW